MKQRSGFTLTEVLVSLFLIGMFGLVALGSLNMALRQWGLMAQKSNAAQNARFLTSTISSELRQAIPYADATNGYLSISPAVAPTGVLLPNANTRASNELRFTEPHPAHYSPITPGWSTSNPNNYRLITYRLEGQEVVRISAPNDGSAPVREVVASTADDGQITLQFAYQGANLCDISVTCQEGDYRTSHTTRCYIMGR